MKIEIWSDIMCPFCYIGKRKFEKALADFNAPEKVEVIWRSYQLDPTMAFVPGKSVHEVLAEKKGWSPQQAAQMNQQVTAMAREVDLAYHLDKAIPANTFLAHRFTHLAAKHNLQDQAEERLFRAYFTEGKNIGDAETLAQLGTEIGLPKEELQNIFTTNAYTAEVQRDITEAQQLGVRGVPFFVFNRKYAVSGAQPTEIFLQTLNQVWEEEKQEVMLVNSGPENNATCTDTSC